MKKHLLSTVLFSTLLVALPGHADCPFSHTDKSDQNAVTAAKAPKVQPHSYATQDATVSWHDLHWFE